MKSRHCFAVLFCLLLQATPSSSFRNPARPFTGAKLRCDVSAAPDAPTFHRRDGTKKHPYSRFQPAPIRDLIAAHAVATRSTASSSSKKLEVTIPEHITVRALTLFLGALYTMVGVARILFRLTQQRFGKYAALGQETPGWPTVGRRVSIRDAIAIAVIASHVSRHRADKHRSSTSVE